MEKQKETAKKAEIAAIIVFPFIQRSNWVIIKAGRPTCAHPYGIKFGYFE